MRDFTADMLNTMWCGDMTFAVGSTRRMPEAWRRISRDLAARKLHPLIRRRHEGLLGPDGLAVVTVAAAPAGGELGHEV